MNILSKIVVDHPRLSFIPDESFYWSPQDNAIHYNPSRLVDIEGSWSLIHELAHGLLGHKTYKTDYELLSYEVVAWEKALQLAPVYDLIIDPDHIEECLDSYREWLYARSTCPTCKLNSLQIKPDAYKCLNCLCKWQVSPSRFCRPYRLKTKTPSEAMPQMVFAEKLAN